MKSSSSDLRQMFLEYFAGKGHEIVPSSSLVPGNDPTLLFTNAGMVQFKDVFLGNQSRKIPRATSSQRCVRAGGKHNDLENVGYTARHHTFFEMLGNFSFGDYFKREAIHYAWEFVTDVLALPPERLWCTVFEDDDEAADIWLKDIGIDAGHFARLGEKDNFWSMGDTGPCGPCSEIFYDHGPDVAGGPPGSAEAEGDRFVEIWNLVFMQFDRSADGEMTPLPAPSVDTGMGLERLAAVVQGVHSNYEIDLFRSLIQAAAELTHTSDLDSSSLRVIADHIRACSFLIVDGIVPGREGRGYVLRRIIRRAVRHGYQLGMDEPFFHKLVATLEAEMGQAYPELSARREHVERVLVQEEERFAETLSQGMRLLEEGIADLPAGGEIAGETVFRLYDTFGFPVDLTADIARERGLVIDQTGFDRAMAAQQQRGREASRFGLSAGHDAFDRIGDKLAASRGPATQFLGYETLASAGTIVGLFSPEGEAVERLAGDDPGLVVLDRSPFYAESGGQVGDTGHIAGGGAEFVVEDTRRIGDWICHVGRLSRGELAAGDRVASAVDAERRAAIVLNHSATHLLHAALREILGEHVEQRGSLVAPDRLRFDFSHFEPVGPDDLRRIEALVNEQIRLNADAETRVMAFDEAIAAGALAFFDDKYGDDVRVLRLGDFSMELCGGTHVRRVGDIGFFKITSEGGIAAGVRRIEAVTGRGALQFVDALETTLLDVAGLVKSGRDDVEAKVSQLVERSKSLEKEVQRLKRRLAMGEGRDLLSDVQEVDGVKLLVARIDGADAKALRETSDRLKSQLGSGVVVLGAVDEGKVRLVASVSADLTGTIPAGELIGPIAQRVGGRGGGRPDFAQAGGPDAEKIDEALALVRHELGRRGAA
jgi:alanyl-tRNA synthetase